MPNSDQTPTTLFLTAHSVPYTMYDYDYVFDPGTIGLLAAAGIGLDQQ